MRITKISLYSAYLPYVGGEYGWGDGYVLKGGDAMVVRIGTDEGLSGWGEVCPIGATYLPAHANGVEGGLRELAPHLLGLDPTNTGLIDGTMDRWMMGHAYVKTPVDVACWDLKGKALGVPCHALLGGRQNDALPMYRVLPHGPIDAMMAQMDAFREQGYSQFQVKVGGDPVHDAARVRAAVERLRPHEKVLADANRGWRRDAALHFGMLTRDLFFYFEQPCTLYDDNLSVRRQVPQPFKLDESIQSMDDMLRVLNDDACDEVCVKIARFGGLTKSRLIRDLCAARDLPMTVEDSWGGEIVTAALGHLAVSTPPGVLLSTTDLHRYNTVSIGTGAPDTVDGKLVVSDRPGLGVEPDLDVLGEPVAVFE